MLQVGAGKRQPLCAAALIDKKHVVSNVNCHTSIIDIAQKSKVHVYFYINSTSYILTSGRSVGIPEGAANDKYDENTQQGDFVIFELAYTLHILPALLSNSPPKPNTEFFVVGSGATVSADLDKHSRYVTDWEIGTLTVQDTSTCASSYQYNPYDGVHPLYNRTHLICALSECISPCDRENGMPLLDVIKVNSQDRVVIFGILSFKANKCTIGSAATFGIPSAYKSFFTETAPGNIFVDVCHETGKC
ncbi:hypothetical protein ABG067_003433 [Albugo candida]